MISSSVLSGPGILTSGSISRGLGVRRLIAGDVCFDPAKIAPTPTNKRWFELKMCL